MGVKKKKNYYAVVSGRVEEPTIFSSWGDAHPRVTGCRAVFKGFPTLQEAREYMAHKEISDYKEVIKVVAEDTTARRGSKACYAVANGATPGIKPVWDGPNGASEATRGIRGACHKSFETGAQAKAFLEDWKESSAEVVRQTARGGLYEGLRPRDASLSVEGLLQGHDQADSLAEQLGTRLRIDES